MSGTIRLAPRDLLLLAGLTLFWGLNWPVMKIGVRELEPMTFRSMSMIGGLPVLWLAARAKGLSLRVPREHWGELALLGATSMVVWFVFAMYGLKLLSSGRAAILGYTMPIWTAVIGAFWFRESAPRRLWVGVGAAAAGVSLLLAGEVAAIAGSPLGTVFMLIAAAVWGYGTHRMRRRKQDTHVLVITFWSLALSLLVCGSLALAVERESWTRWPNATEWTAIAYNSLVIFGFTQVVWFRLATILPPMASSLSVMLIPVIGLFSGMLMLGERPAWQDWFALACILVAIGTVLLPARTPRPPD